MQAVPEVLGLWRTGTDHTIAKDSGLSQRKWQGPGEIDPGVCALNTNLSAVQL